MRLPLAALLLCCAALPARADDARKEPLAAYVYDLTDLLRALSRDDANDSTLVPPTQVGRARPGNASGNGPNGANAEAGATVATERLEALGKLIQETIDPPSWREAGGTDGAVRVFENSLVITHDRKHHDQIDLLLRNLRQQATRMVRIRAVWANLTPDELRSITRPVAAPEKVTDELAELDRANAAVLEQIDLGALEKISGAVRYRAQAGCYSGHTARLAAGRARTVVTALAPVVGNAVGMYEPQTDVVLSGPALELAPALSADNATVTLDLRCTLGQWPAAAADPIRLPKPTVAPILTTQPTGTTSDVHNSAAASPASKVAPRPAPAQQASPAPIDRLDLAVQSLTTIVQVPAGKAVLIGTIPTDTDPAAAPDPRPVRQLYLIVEATGPEPTRKR